MDVLTVVNHTNELGECPLWDSKRKAIIWVDILKGEIHEFSILQNDHRTLRLNEMVGSVALFANGNLLAALKSGLASVDRGTGKVKILVHPELHLNSNRFNDGKCDPEGRFWVGTLSLTEEERAGSLYRVNGDFSCSKMEERLTIPNGMVWSLDRSRFYFIDTPTKEIAVYDYDLSRGTITNKRTAISFEKEEGVPDGMTIDSEGMLWIAHWGGWQVSCWNPATGKKLFHISLPVGHVTSCTFGGENLQDLYITSARKGLTSEQLKQQPLAGSLFVVRDTGFRGLPTFEFKQD
jgi:sugar lactone lactonase YvrE